MPSVTRFPTANELVGGQTSWTNPDNAHVDDNIDATASLTWPSNGNVLIGNRWKNFDFDSVLPPLCTITSVIVNVESQGSFLTGQSNSGAIVSPNVGGVDTGGGYSLWGISSGSPTHARDVINVDITGAIPWTRNDLLDANFKMMVRADGSDQGTSTGGTASAAIDYVSVTVTYVLSQGNYESGRF